MWQLIKSCNDAGKFTQTELITLKYIQDNFMLSPQMQEQLRMILFAYWSNGAIVVTSASLLATGS